MFKPITLDFPIGNVHLRDCFCLLELSLVQAFAIAVSTKTALWPHVVVCSHASEEVAYERTSGRYSTIEVESQRNITGS